VHNLPSPASANFTLMMDCTPESSRCYSVYSVGRKIEWEGRYNNIGQRDKEGEGRERFGDERNRKGEEEVRLRVRKWKKEAEKFIRKGHERMRAGVEKIRDREVCCSFQEKRTLNICNVTTSRKQ
jgi:hypothetical protein